MEKKLQRDEQHKKIAGVCAGLAEYLDTDVTLVRVLFVVALVFHGCGLIPYIVLWIVLPKKTYFNNASPFNNAGPVDYTMPPQPGNPVDYSVPNPFGSFTPPSDAPFVAPPKKRSNAGLVVGIALVAFGSFFLLDEFDLLPDWEFDRLWPLVLVLAGLILMFTPKKQNPWEKENWHVTDTPATEPKSDASAENNAAENNPPVV